MKTYKYISRVDSIRSPGWWFRLCLTGSTVTHSKFFSDGKYNSKEQALKKAIRYRNKIVKNLGIQKRLNIKGKIPEKHYRNKKNTSGVIGVTYVIQYRRGNAYHFWQAHFNINGKQHHKLFSIGKYGDCEAFKKACLVRYEKAGTLSIYKNHRLPCRLPANIYKFIAK